MNKKSLVLLAVTTLVVTGVAWIILKQRSPETEIASIPLFPELVNRVNEISRIEIRTRGQTTVLAKRGQEWIVENRSQFPALFEKVKGTVLALAELEILEAKTKNRELYPKLGVEDVDAQGATSTLISLLNPKGQMLASLIVGKQRISKSGRGSAALYVRKAGEDQAWLVKGSLDLSAQPTAWLNKKLLDISAERIREITIQHPEQNPIRIYRKDRQTKDYTLENLPKGSKLRSQVMLNSVATALEDLWFDDVASPAEITLSPKRTVTTLRAFDGLVATVVTAPLNDHTYAHFEFSYDAEAAAQTSPSPPSAKNSDSEPAELTHQSTSKPQSKQDRSEPASQQKSQESVAQEVARLNEQTRPWVYMLPGFKATLLTKTMQELVMPKEEKSTDKEEMSK